MSRDPRQIAASCAIKRHRSANRLSSENESASGAVILGRELIVTTVERVDRGQPRLVPGGTFSLHLEGRSQHYTKHFVTEVGGWLRICGIQRLALRMTNMGKHYVPSPYAFKIETALQLMPSLDIHVVDAGSVTVWVKILNLACRHLTPMRARQRRRSAVFVRSKWLFSRSRMPATCAIFRRARMHSRVSSHVTAARYPTRAQIARAVQAARSNGLSVESVDVLRDGTIRVGPGVEREATGTELSLFDELNAAGRL